jgi:CBS domain-containing protein
MKAPATESAKRVCLKAATAVDLMTAEPVVIPSDATLKEAILLLVDRHISGAPVVDRAGKVVGVLSRSDIVTRDRESVDYAWQAPEYYTRGELDRVVGESLPGGFQVEQVDRTRVHEIMTPVVHSVMEKASAEEVIHRMVTLNVHRLFVVDGPGTLIGVITTMDIVRNLLP